MNSFYWDNFEQGQLKNLCEQLSDRKYLLGIAVRIAYETTQSKDEQQSFNALLKWLKTIPDGEV